MKRLLGIFVLLVVVYLFTWIFAENPAGFIAPYNQGKLLERTALAGILAIGVAFVIMTGGIDLSIGSVVCLVGVGLPYMLIDLGWPLYVALPIVLIVPLLIGLWHGLLITKLNLQPFVVTLCGLLIYRGVTRGFTGDQSVGYQGQFSDLRTLGNGNIPLGDFPLSVPFFIMVIIAVLAGIFLNKTIHGRYILAIGNNEEAARFSGINTKKMTILVYVISSGLAGLGGILYSLNNSNAQPVDFGNFYELYAIAAAVLGGCSLRGGTGSIIGVIIGAALMQLLANMINMIAWIPNNIEFAVVGAVILAGAIGDEIAKKVVAKRRAAAVAKEAT